MRRDLLFVAAQRREAHLLVHISKHIQLLLHCCSNLVLPMQVRVKIEFQEIQSVLSIGLTMRHMDQLHKLIVVFDHFCFDW